MRTRTTCLVMCLIALVAIGTPDAPACTSIMVGKGASSDGSVMTSHTCDSHRTASSIHVVPRKQHESGAELALTKRSEDNDGAMERYGRVATGTLPQVAETFGYLSPAYASMNEHQVAIGESTFSGRKELVSEKGLIDCETLTRLMLERARSAREAIRIGGSLIERYGWVDEGEALTIADPHEVWLMEMVGPGKDRVGAVWAAQRIPDGHVSVIANSSRIGEIDLDDPDFFMASANVVSAAVEMGYWSEDSGRPFRFYEAYNPEGNLSFASSRRVWRVFDLVAPSLKLHGNTNFFPVSIKPDEPVSAERIMEIFRDTFEGTDYDTVKHLTVTDEEGNTAVSPLANPFMPYDMNQMLRINGGWGWRGERHLARWYCMYVTVTQSRSQLPNEVGGIVWFGYDNPAMTTYVPLYAGVTELPPSYTTDGRTTGFSREVAWWAANRASTIAAHRWGEMRADVAEVRDPLQRKYLDMQDEVAERAVALLAADREQALAYLTEVTKQACEEVTEAYWDLGDHLWTAYDEKW